MLVHVKEFGVEKVTTRTDTTQQEGFVCDVYAGIAVSTKSVYGVAKTYSCTGDPLPTECRNEVELQVSVPHIDGGAWGTAGEGKVVYGCEGGASTLTLSDCSKYTENVDYRSLGLFTITWEGANYPDSDYSPAESTDYICS